MNFRTILFIFSLHFCLYETKSALSTKRTTLMDMNVDIHREIFDQLPLEDLLRMASTSKYFADMATDVFRLKYSTNLIEIRNSFGKSDNVMYFSGGITLTDPELAANILTTFGHMIKKLLISYRTIDGDQARKVNEYVSRFCNESLNQLHFEGFTDDPLLGMSQLFPNVEVVSFNGEATRIGNETTKINEIFPKLQQLYLSIGKIEVQACIDLQFIYLQHLSIVFSWPDLQFFTFNDKVIESVLRKNPQIQSVQFEFASLSFLKKVNEILPNLRELSINSMTSEVEFLEEIRFRRVEKLSFEPSNDNVPSLAFDRLKEIEFNCNGVITPRWIDFFGTLASVTKFHVTKSGQIRPAELKRLADKLANLTAVSLIAGAEITKADVIDFVEHSKHLETLHMIVLRKDQIVGLENDLADDFAVKSIWDEYWGRIDIERRY